MYWRYLQYEYSDKELLLGGVRDVTSVIISHEQTQSNHVCCFQTLDAVFPKDLFVRFVTFAFKDITLSFLNILNIFCRPHFKSIRIPTRVSSA